MMTDEQDQGRKSGGIGLGGWIALAVLALLLVAAIAYAVHAWNQLQGVAISPMGWVFMGCGVLFTILVGGGLMALLFYSSRKNFDQ